MAAALRLPGTAIALACPDTPGGNGPVHRVRGLQRITLNGGLYPTSPPAARVPRRALPEALLLEIRCQPDVIGLHEDVRLLYDMGAVRLKGRPQRCRVDCLRAAALDSPPAGRLHTIVYWRPARGGRLIYSD